MSIIKTTNMSLALSSIRYVRNILKRPYQKGQIHFDSRAVSRELKRHIEGSLSFCTVLLNNHFLPVPAIQINELFTPIPDEQIHICKLLCIVEPHLDQSSEV